MSTDALINRMVTGLLDQIEAPNCKAEDKRALIQTMCIVTRDIGHRLGNYCYCNSI